MNAMPMPATAAAAMPSTALPVVSVTAKPTMAPTSIMPSIAEIEDAGFLGHQLAGGGQQQRGRGADHRENDRDEPAHAGHDGTLPR